MANGQYIGVNGVARKVVSPYIGVDGIARNVKSGYVGVDGVARLFFAPESGAPVILEVEKITADTTTDNTTIYSGEEFLILDIYPKTGGTVNVTYGGLTKTITDTSGAKKPNAQAVYFGTLYGVSDSVATPTSGTLTISGDYRGFAVGSYTIKGTGKTSTDYCGCITAATDISGIETLPSNAFRNCSSITDIYIPESIKSISSYAFYGCRSLNVDLLLEGITDIGDYAFYGLPWRDYTFGKSLVRIGNSAFYTLEEDIEAADGYENPRKIIFDGCIPALGNSAFSHKDEQAGGLSLNSRTYIYYEGFNNRWNDWVTIEGYYYDDAAAFKNTSIIDLYLDGVSTLDITSVTLPYGCAKINAYAFYSGFCNLIDITIPASVKSIGKKALFISNTPQITMLSEEPPTIDSETFMVYSMTDKSYYPTIIVPKGCGATYKAAENWSNFADYIVEAS